MTNDTHTTPDAAPSGATTNGTTQLTDDELEIVKRYRECHEYAIISKYSTNLLITIIDRLDRELDALRRGYYPATAPQPAPTPDAMVPIHADPLEGLRKAIEGHVLLTKLEAMTKLYEMQRMAKNMTPTGVNPSTPQVVIRLRGLRIEEMGPNDCVIELIKLAEMLTPQPSVTAPDRAAVRLSFSEQVSEQVSRNANKSYGSSWRSYTAADFKVGDEVAYTIWSRFGKYEGTEYGTVVKLTNKRVTIELGDGQKKSVSPLNLQPKAAHDAERNRPVRLPPNKR